MVEHRPVLLSERDDLETMGRRDESHEGIPGDERA